MIAKSQKSSYNSPKKIFNFTLETVELSPNSKHLDKLKCSPEINSKEKVVQKKETIVRQLVDR